MAQFKIIIIAEIFSLFLARIKTALYMESPESFRIEAHKLVDWIADYYSEIEKYPVKSTSKPGTIFQQIPDSPPEMPEEMPAIFDDFKKIILPGITHWQHPGFFAYFPANSSFPSLLAEMLTAALGAQCMKWETSPAATELEEAMMNWLKNMIGLPQHFEGVIQDSGSTSTLCAIISAREKHSHFDINSNGMSGKKVMRVYCSSEAHSSIDKAVKIAGIGRENLVKIGLDKSYRMKPDLLEQAIQKDIELGNIPVCVVAALGTTGSTAVDPLDKIAAICEKYNIWLHVDAAFSGSALLLPEYRWMIGGIEKADSFVFNPHKWLFTNFDCSAYFVRDSETLINTFKLVPEYLKSQIPDHVNDYSNWGVQLGRRFRALKLWFVIRSFGIAGLRQKIRKHIELAADFKKQIEAHPDFEIMAEVLFNLVCFRFHPAGITDGNILNNLNEKLLLQVNGTGALYITHTKLDGMYVLRIVTGQTNVESEHVEKAWKIIQNEASIIHPVKHKI